MCAGGGGGGSGGGGGGMGGGFGGGFSGMDFGFGGNSLSFGGGGNGDLVAAPVEGITSPVNPNIDEADKKFLGSKPGFSEDKMTALANKSGKSQLYIK